MPQKQDDCYDFLYEFEFIAKNHGNDNYDIDTATMNVHVEWSAAQEGYVISYDVPEMNKIDPAEGNSDAAGFYDYDVYPRLMDDLAGRGIYAESIAL